MFLTLGYGYLFTIEVVFTVDLVFQKSTVFRKMREECKNYLIDQ